jgi:hypothetical protein
MHHEAYRNRLFVGQIVDKLSQRRVQQILASSPNFFSQETMQETCNDASQRHQNAPMEFSRRYMYMNKDRNNEVFQMEQSLTLMVLDRGFADPTWEGNCGAGQFGFGHAERPWVWRDISTDSEKDCVGCKEAVYCFVKLVVTFWVFFMRVEGVVGRPFIQKWWQEKYLELS